MSMAAQYAGLKRRIEQYESDHPDTVVLAVRPTAWPSPVSPPVARRPTRRWRRSSTRRSST